MNHTLIIEGVSAGNLLALLGIFWRVSRAAGMIEQIMRDFPPHRHVGSKIIYPKGFDLEG